MVDAQLHLDRSARELRVEGQILRGSVESLVEQTKETSQTSYSRSTMRNETIAWSEQPDERPDERRAPQKEGAGQSLAKRHKKGRLAGGAKEGVESKIQQPARFNEHFTS